MRFGAETTAEWPDVIPVSILVCRLVRSTERWAGVVPQHGALITDHSARARSRAALLVALVTMAIGVVGIVHPDVLTTTRRLYFATPGRMYVAGAVRLAMGLVLILAAAGSRWPRILRALGALMCLQSLSATLMGPERARAILEWETMHPTLLRAGAVVALVSGAFIAFAVTTRSSDERRIDER